MFEADGLLSEHASLLDVVEFEILFASIGGAFVRGLEVAMTSSHKREDNNKDQSYLL